MVENRPDPGPKALPERMHAGRSTLGRVIREAERLLAIQDHIHQLLPANLRPHVSVAGLNTGHLSLFVSTSARATQLRLQQQRLQTQLADRAGEPIVQISIKVRPMPKASPKIDAPEATGIPATAAAHFAEMAQFETDPELKKALQRLAHRGR